MDEKTLNRIIEQIKYKGMPPTLGYVIDERIFSLIAEKAATNIYEWGWKRYVDYMNTWRLKVR